MSNKIPACQFGYLSLTHGDGATVLIKANKIKAIEYYEEDRSVIYFDEQSQYFVDQKIEEILSQLEAIHPSLR